MLFKWLHIGAQYQHRAAVHFSSWWWNTQNNFRCQRIVDKVKIMEQIINFKFYLTIGKRSGETRKVFAASCMVMTHYPVGCFFTTSITFTTRQVSVVVLHDNNYVGCFGCDPPSHCLPCKAFPRQAWYHAVIPLSILSDLTRKSKTKSITKVNKISVSWYQGNREVQTHKVTIVDFASSFKQLYIRAQQCITSDWTYFATY